MFQSAPPVETRGDDTGQDPTTITSVFQSAPPVETRGDLFAYLLLWPFHLVSIRSPRRNEGRRTYRALWTLYARVSIRSPRRNEGRRLIAQAIASSFSLFQSAPPVETRGDPPPRPRAPA